MPTVSEITLPNEIEEAIQDFAAGVRSEGYGEDASNELNALRRAIRTAIFEATGQRLPPMIWLQMDEGEPWHLFGDLDTVAACGAAITTSRPHVEERMTPENACPACVDHAKERGLRMT